MHMPREFVTDFGTRLHAARGKDFLLLGEAYTGDQQFLASIQKETGLDMMYDFPLSNTIRSVVGKNEDQGFFGRWRRFFHLREAFPGEAWRVRTSRGANPEWFHELFEKDKIYQNPAGLMTIIENHDMPRFMAAAGPRARDKFLQALTLQYCFRGVPCLYYGAEDGMGMTDEDIRADKRHGADPQMFARLEKLGALRHGSKALRRGEQREITCDRQVYAFSRVHQDETVVVVANVDKKSQERDIPLPGGCKKGYRLENLLTGEISTISGDTMRVTLGAADMRVLRITPLE